MNGTNYDSDLVSKHVILVTEEEVKPLSAADQILLEQQRILTYKVNRIIAVWEAQQTEDRKLKKSYAKVFMMILIAQLLIVNAIVVLISLKLISLPEWMLNVFIVSVFGEVTGIVLIIVRNLFASTGKEMIDLIKDLK